MIRRNLPVLCYHAIDAADGAGGAIGHSRSVFAQHLDLIHALGFVTISTAHLLDICAGSRPLDRRYVVLTFDDALASHWLDAAPMLAARGMTGVFFAVTDFIRPGGPRSRAEAPPPMDAGSAFRRAVAEGDCTGFMNESELAALVHDMGMEVHSHSASHRSCFRNLKRKARLSDGAHWGTWGIYPEPDGGLPVFERGSAHAYDGFWPAFRPGEIPAFRLRSEAERQAFCREDLGRSVQRIAGINRAERQLLCWPWGQYDAVGEEACRAAGFSGAFTLERLPIGPGTDPFRLGRIRVGPTKTAQWLRMRLLTCGTAAGARLFSKTFRKKRETKRILYVTDSTKMSGGSRQLLQDVAAMTTYGIDVRVVAPPDTPVASALTGAGAVLVPWDEPRRLIRSARLLARVAREERIDVMHTMHSRPAKSAVLAKLMGGRFALFLNRGVIHRPNPLTGLFAMIADGVICNSQAGARVLCANLVPRTRINVVYNSVAAPALPGRIRAPGADLRVLWVGNGNPVKGHEIFLRAASRYAERHPGSSASFASYGVERTAALVREGDGRAAEGVEAHGPASHESVLDAMADADVLVLTSRIESLPNVLLEAFSLALPVVCTDVGGVGEVVRNGVNGFVVSVGDIDAIAERVHDLVEYPERRRAMGAINQRLAAVCFNNARKGYLLLRVYSGERVADDVAWEAIAEGPTGRA